MVLPWLSGCSFETQNVVVADAPNNPVMRVAAAGQGPDIGIKTIDNEGPFVSFDKEPSSRRMSPYETQGIVPIARLHMRLAEMQIESLRTRSPIVRYEVVDLEPKVQPLLYDVKAAANDGLVATALVYVATPREGSIPLSAKGIMLFKEGHSSGHRGKLVSPEFKTIKVRVIEFELAPVGLDIRTTEAGTMILVGADDWRIVAEKQVRTSGANVLVDELPVNDPSAIQLFGKKLVDK